MPHIRPIQSALISVYNKDGLAPLVKKLHEIGAVIYSTGGTSSFIAQQEIPVVQIEDVTLFPEILGGGSKPFT